MEWVEWVFSGIGTQFISFIAGIIIGGVGGYKIAIRKSYFRQTQKARDNSVQIQTGEIKSV